MSRIRVNEKKIRHTILIFSSACEANAGVASALEEESTDTRAETASEVDQSVGVAGRMALEVFDPELIVSMI
jgi:hypothetical protein